VNKLLEVQISDENHIMCHSMSKSGRYLAYASASATKLFKMTHRQKGKVKAAEIPLGDLSPKFVQCLKLSDDDSKLFLGLKGGLVKVLDLSDRSHKTHKFEENEENVCLEICAGGKFAAAAFDDGSIQVFDGSTLSPVNRVVQKEFVRSMTFLGSSSFLLFLTLKGGLKACDVSSLNFPQISGVERSSEEIEMSGRFCLNSENPNFSLVYDGNSIRRVNVSAGSLKYESERKRAKIEGSKCSEKNVLSFSLGESIGDYRHLLKVGYISEGELVAVELPWENVLNSNAGALFKYKYGT